MKLNVAEHKAPDKQPSTPAPVPKKQDAGPPPELLAAPKDAPSSTELEAEVLGSIIMDSDVLEYALDTLRPADFYGEAHRRIYRAIVTLAERDEGLDMVTVLDQMRNTPGFTGGDVATLMNAHDLQGTAAFGYQKIDRLKEYGDRRMIMRAGEEVITTAKRKGSKAALAQLESLLPSLVNVGGDVGRALDIAKRYASGQAMALTGWPRFDTTIGGIPRNDLTVIAARSFTGKSQFLYPIANHIGESTGVPFDIITPDQPISEILAAEAARRSDTPLVDLAQRKQAYLTEVDNLQHTFLKNVRLHQGAVGVGDVERIARRAARLGTSGIALDTMNRVGYGKEGKVNMLAELGTLLKDLAMEFDIPVIGLAQIRREVDERPNRKPTVSDIADAPGSIVNDANMILLLYREGRYTPTDARDETLEVIVGKHKLGKAGRVVALKFEQRLARVFDPSTVTPRSHGLFGGNDAPKEKPQAQVRAQPKGTG